MKRIVCVLLTLIMLLGMVPMGASAASHSTSEAAITVLKQMSENRFKSECYLYRGTEFRIGYGTVCNEKGHKVDTSTLQSIGDKHTISQVNADKALREALKAVDTKVNNFASSNGVSLSQNEHDALVIFTYGVGDAWMNGTGALKNIIVKGTESTELVGALMQFGNNDRRLVEANMYLNGVYSNTMPTRYVAVTYYQNGGYIAQGDGYTMYYDAAEAKNHVPVATHSGTQRFLGWYSAQTGGTWIPVVHEGLNNAKLYAHYAAPGTFVSANYTMDATYISPKAVYDDSLEKLADSKKQELIAGKKSVTVIGEKLDAAGNHWCNLASGAWVKVSAKGTGYVSAVTTNAQVKCTVTVTNSYVNRRVNATASSAKNGSYKQGDVLNVLQEDGGWLQIGEVKADGSVVAVGWVSSIYTNYGSTQENAAGGAQSTSVIGTAVVTVKGYLNIRQEPGTDAKILGALAQKDTVELYEIKTVNGHQWGRTKSGWICLTYTQVNLLDNVVISDAGSKAYTFTGKVQGGDITTQVGAGVNNIAQYKDYQDKMQNLVIKNGKAVTLSNLLVVDGATWAKATWSNDELAWKDANKKETVTKTVTRSGWVEVSNAVAAVADDAEIVLDPIKYTVAVDSLNVRTAPGDANDRAYFLDKGTEVEVNKIALVGENIWGLITKVTAVPSGAVNVNYLGWINLASKYVTRGNLPADVETSAPSTGKIGTVVNADSLRVRTTGATYAAQIGSLKRGATVAVWEENDGWYKVDSNQNGTYDYEGDGWVSGNYLDVREGTVGGNSTVTDAAGNKYETDGTGKGVVANTYAGVNVRSGPSTAYASKGKLLPGTIVEILEVSGNGKWGRTAQGWVSLDYITMLSYNEALNNALNGGNSTTPNGGIQVESFDKAEKVSTTAVYSGKINAETNVYAEPNEKANVICTISAGDNITVHELAKVTAEVKGDPVNNENGSTSVTTTTTTSYWARINDGWVKDPASCIALNALDEKVYTLTSGDKKVTADNGKEVTLKNGDQLNVTALRWNGSLAIEGRIETSEGAAWIALSLLSEGAVYEAPKVEQNTNTNTGTNTIVPPTIGAGSSTGGFVTNTSGYRYTGNVIRTDTLNVRATPSTTAAKTTTLKNGQALVIYETTNSENMAWGRCDAGWVYLYYVDLVPATGAVDARVVANDNTVAYTDMNCTAVAGTYSRQSVIDIFEIVGKMARTELGWVNTDNLL